MGFNPPNWASQPCREATLEAHNVDGSVDRTPIDMQPWYICGRYGRAAPRAAAAAASNTRAAAGMPPCPRQFIALTHARACNRDASCCDVVLGGSHASRQHAALVHHQDGRLFLIDLQSVSLQPCVVCL